TDSYYTQGDRLPADEELGERVKVFDVSHADGQVAATLANRFGDTQGAGVLRTVESIWGDVAHNRVLVADENETRLDVKIYDLDGRFTGTLIGSGLFKREPEGIALIECGADGDGYWLISDQHTPRQIFRLFDRRTLAYVGSFAPGAAHTVDGVWFHPAPFDDFPSGALFVQHADAAVAAFD